MFALNQRRRLLAVKGRPATLRRQTVVKPPVYTDVEMQALVTHYAPGEVVGALQQGDARAVITHDEIDVAGWPLPVRVGDLFVLDGVTWKVEGATPVYEGAALIGTNLWIRGGA